MLLLRKAPNKNQRLAQRSYSDIDLWPCLSLVRIGQQSYSRVEEWSLVTSPSPTHPPTSARLPQTARPLFKAGPEPRFPAAGGTMSSIRDQHSVPLNDGNCIPILGLGTCALDNVRLGLTCEGRGGGYTGRNGTLRGEKGE